MNNTITTSPSSSAKAIPIPYEKTSSTINKTASKLISLKWKISLGIGTIVFVTCVVLLGLWNIKVGNIREKAPVQTGPSPDTAWTGMKIKIRPVKIDSKKYEQHFRLSYQPSGGLLSSKDVTGKVLGTAVNVTRNGDDLQGKKDTAISPDEIKLPFTTGNNGFYPFDTYTSTIRLSGVVIDDNNNTTPMNLWVSSNGALQGWRIDTDIYQDSEGTTDYLIRYTYKRGYTTRVFSMIMTTIMWTFSILFSYSTLYWVKRKKKLKVGHITLLTTLGFSLPVLRSVQPDIPPFGILLDYLSFYWAQMFLFVSISILLFRMIYDAHHDYFSGNYLNNKSDED